MINTREYSYINNFFTPYFLIYHIPYLLINLIIHKLRFYYHQTTPVPLQIEHALKLGLPQLENFSIPHPSHPKQITFSLSIILSTKVFTVKFTISTICYMVAIIIWRCFTNFYHLLTFFFLTENFRKYHILKNTYLICNIINILVIFIHSFQCLFPEFDYYYSTFRFYYFTIFHIFHTP